MVGAFGNDPFDSLAVQQLPISRQEVCLVGTDLGREHQGITGLTPTSSDLKPPRDPPLPAAGRALVSGVTCHCLRSARAAAAREAMNNSVRDEAVTAVGTWTWPKSWTSAREIAKIQRKHSVDPGRAFDLLWQKRESAQACWSVVLIAELPTEQQLFLRRLAQKLDSEAEQRPQRLPRWWRRQ